MVNRMLQHGRYGFLGSCQIGVFVDYKDQALVLGQSADFLQGVIKTLVLGKSARFRVLEYLYGLGERGKIFVCGRLQGGEIYRRLVFAKFPKKISGNIKTVMCV